MSKDTLKRGALGSLTLGMSEVLGAMKQPDVPTPATPPTPPTPTTEPSLEMPDPNDPVKKKKREASILRGLQTGSGGTILSQKLGG